MPKHENMPKLRFVALSDIDYSMVCKLVGNSAVFFDMTDEVKALRNSMDSHLPSEMDQATNEFDDYLDRTGLRNA